MSTEGVFINLLQTQQQISDKRTKKAEQKVIKKSEYLPPPGHISIIRNGTSEDGDRTSHLIFHNGIVWKHGRTWDYAEDWFCLDISWNLNSISCDNLKHVQAFHVTSKSTGPAMEECSTSFGYVQAASCDLSDESSDLFKVIIFGGQSTETATTSDRLEIISGPNDFDGPLDCQAYRSHPREYSEFKLPREYKRDLDSIQTGKVPTSRCGYSLGKLSANLLVCTGGLSIPKADKNKFHPSDSNIFLLKHREIEWIQLEGKEELQRTEHTMQIFNNKVYIVGGYSFRNHLASQIFPYNEVIEVEIHHSENNESFWCSVKTIQIEIMPEFGSPYLTNMSFAGDSSNMYLFGGYKWPNYDPVKENMYELCPPRTSHNKKPKQDSGFVILDLMSMTIQHTRAPGEFATADGSLQILSKNEDNQLESLLIVGGVALRIDVYSKLNFCLEKCEISDEYGGCGVTLATRDKETLSCSVVGCSHKVHLICDLYTKALSRKTNENYVCPKCADYDPVTKKKRPKGRKNN